MENQALVDNCSRKITGFPHLYVFPLSIPKIIIFNPFQKKYPKSQLEQPEEKKKWAAAPVGWIPFAWNGGQILYEDELGEII